jgi:hypothetical protein
MAQAQAFKAAYVVNVLLQHVRLRLGRRVTGLRQGRFRRQQAGRGLGARRCPVEAAATAKQQRR